MDQLDLGVAGAHGGHCVRGEDQKRGRKRVGDGGHGRAHPDVVAAAQRGGAAGARIDDVGALRGGTGPREGLVAQVGHFLGQARAHRPALAIGARAAGQDGAAAGVEQEVGEAEHAPPAFADLVERIAFADAPEVDLHAVGPHAGAHRVRIEVEQMHPAAGGGVLDFPPRRTAGRAVRADPTGEDRPDRDVEGTLGGGVDVAGQQQAVHGGGTDAGRFAGGQGVEAADVAVGPEPGQFALEHVDLADGRPARFVDRDRGLRRHEELPRRGHGLVGEVADRHGGRRALGLTCGPHRNRCNRRTSGCRPGRRSPTRPCARRGVPSVRPGTPS